MPISIRYHRSFSILAFGAVLAVLWWAGLIATVKPIGGSTARDSFPSAGLAFKPKAYVARIWSKRVVPDVHKRSVPLPAFLSAVDKNKVAALQNFGRKVAGTYNILVRFTGTLGKLDTSTPIGAVTVHVPVRNKTITVKVATGPVILGTSLRDALRFIHFNEFLNQIQYGDVGDALNSYVVHDVIGPLHLSKLKGRPVTIYGAFTYNNSNSGHLTVIPVIFQIDKGK